MNENYKSVTCFRLKISLHEHSSHRRCERWANIHPPSTKSKQTNRRNNYSSELWIPENSEGLFGWGWVRLSHRVSLTTRQLLLCCSGNSLCNSFLIHADDADNEADINDSDTHSPFSVINNLQNKGRTGNFKKGSWFSTLVPSQLKKSVNESEEAAEVMRVNDRHLNKYMNINQTRAGQNERA